MPTRVGQPGGGGRSAAAGLRRDVTRGERLSRLCRLYARPRPKNATARRRRPVAQRTLVLLEDDIDGDEAIETILFGLDRTTYESDLNENNAVQLRDAVAPFVGAGRPAGRPAGAPTCTARPSTRSVGNTA